MARTLNEECSRSEAVVALGHSPPQAITPTLADSAVRSKLGVLGSGARHIWKCRRINREEAVSELKTRDSRQILLAD